MHFSCGLTVCRSTLQAPISELPLRYEVPLQRPIIHDTKDVRALGYHAESYLVSQSTFEYHVQCTVAW
jgi:hypothetical protein